MGGLYETTTTECVYAECTTNVVARGAGMVGGGELGTWIASGVLFNNGGVGMNCEPTQDELDAATRYVRELRMEAAAAEMCMVIRDLLDAYAPDRHKHKRASLHSSVRNAMDILDKIDGRDPR